MDALIPLDVMLNDGRSYVQGAQLIARAANVLIGKGVLVDQAVVHAAAFHSITDHRVSLRIGPPETTGTSLGTVTFLAPSGDRI